MGASRASEAIKRRRAELELTQQNAARRAEVSLATWRRFENSVSELSDLEAFRTENLKGISRALGMTVAGLRSLIDDDASKDDLGRPAAGETDGSVSEFVKFINRSFRGTPLTPSDAMALAGTVDFSDFVPTRDGRLHLELGMSGRFAEYLKGEVTIRDVELLCDLPELALIVVSNHWLVRMGERIQRVGALLGEGKLPDVQCLADEYALWIVITNSEPPQLQNLGDVYPGLETVEDVFGFDPDTCDGDDSIAITDEWRERMISALLLSEDHDDHRRHDLIMMEAFGQSVCDPSDPRHPNHWFDREDLRERFESESAFVRLPEEEKQERIRESLRRAGEHLENMFGVSGSEASGE